MSTDYAHEYGRTYGTGSEDQGSNGTRTPEDWARLYSDQAKGQALFAEEQAAALSESEDSEGFDDLTEGWDDPPSEPLVILRSDRKALGYLGMSHVIGGASESGKTRLADLATLQEVQAGRPVVRYDLENGPGMTRQILRDMGMNIDQMKTLVRYKSASAPWSVGKAEKEAQQFVSEGGRLVVLDSSTALASALGLQVSGGSSEDVERLYRIAMDPWKNAGCAVFIVDNTNKSDKTDLSGSQHKKAGLDAGIAVVSGKPFAVGHPGYSDLYVLKDRGAGMPWQVADSGKRFIGRMHSTPEPEFGSRGVRFWIQPAESVGLAQGPGGLADAMAGMDLGPSKAEQNAKAKDHRLRQLAAQMVKMLPPDPERGLSATEAMGQAVDVHPRDRKRCAYLATTAEVASMTEGWILKDASGGVGQARKYYRVLESVNGIGDGDE